MAKTKKQLEEERKKRRRMSRGSDNDSGSDGPSSGAGEGGGGGLAGMTDTNNDTAGPGQDHTGGGNGNNSWGSDRDNAAEEAARAAEEAARREAEKFEKESQETINNEMNKGDEQASVSDQAVQEAKQTAAYGVEDAVVGNAYHSLGALSKSQLEKTQVGPMSTDESITNQMSTSSTPDFEGVGSYNTFKSPSEIMNDREREYQDTRQQAALDNAWDSFTDGEIGDALSSLGNALGATVSESVADVKGWGMRQAREWTQAPVDKLADVMNDPLALGLGTAFLGPGYAIAATTMGIGDAVMDYTQGEATGEQAALQGVSSALNLASPMVQTIGEFGIDMYQNPEDAMVNAGRNIVGGMIPGMDGIFTSRLKSKALDMGEDALRNNIRSGKPVNSMTAKYTSGISKARQSADNQLYMAQMNNVQRGIQPQIYSPFLIEEMKKSLYPRGGSQNFMDIYSLV